MNDFLKFAATPDGNRWMAYSSSQQNWVPVEPEVVRRHRPDLLSPPKSGGMFGDVLIGAGYGASLGWLDELAEQSKHLVTDSELERLGMDRDQFGTAMRGEAERRYGQAGFWPRIVGELAGGMITGGPILKAMQGLTRLSPVGSLAASGGIEGAVAGAGMSDDDRIGGAVKGGLLGTVAAPAAGAVLTGLSAAGQNLLSRLRSSPRQDAMKLVRDALNADMISAQDARVLMSELGPEATLADVGQNLTGLAQAARGPMGPGRTRASEFLEARQAGQQARVGEIARQELGPAWENYWRFIDDVQTQRNAQAAPFYQRAYEQSIQPTERMRMALNTDTGRRATREALRRMTDKIGTPEAAGIGTDPDGEMSVLFLHEIKRVLNDFIGRRMREGETNLAGDIMGIKRHLIDDLNEMVPEYRIANDIYAGAREIEEAAEFGRSLLGDTKMFAGDLRNAISDYSASEMDALRVGFFRGILDRVETTVGMGDSARRITRDDRMRQISRMLFPDLSEAGTGMVPAGRVPDGGTQMVPAGQVPDVPVSRALRPEADRFERYLERLAGEQRQAETRQEVLFKSPTQPRQAFGESIETASDVAQAVTAGSLSGFVLPIMRMLRNTPNMTPEVADEVSNLLFNRNLSQSEWDRLSRLSQTAMQRADVPPLLGLGGTVPAVGLTQPGNE